MSTSSLGSVEWEVREGQTISKGYPANRLLKDHCRCLLLQGSIIEIQVRLSYNNRSGYDPTMNHDSHIKSRIFQRRLRRIPRILKCVYDLTIMFAIAPISDIRCKIWQKKINENSRYDHAIRQFGCSFENEFIRLNHRLKNVYEVTVKLSK